jgi:hypothetical protein
MDGRQIHACAIGFGLGRPVVHYAPGLAEAEGTQTPCIAPLCKCCCLRGWRIQVRLHLAAHAPRCREKTCVPHLARRLFHITPGNRAFVVDTAQRIDTLCCGC